MSDPAVRLPDPAPMGADFLLGDFPVELGGVVPHASLRYRVFGSPARGRTHGWNLVFHDLTGSADVDRWWGSLLRAGRALDTSARPLLAANHLGGCSGSTGPREWGGPHAGAFPALTPRDLARAVVPLAQHLGIERIGIAAGVSLGGMVALEWGRITPVPVEHLAVFGAPAVTSPQVIAWNAAQRMAIEADPAWAAGRYRVGAGPAAGLAAARAIALSVRRSGSEFAARFGRSDTGHEFAVERYLRLDGERLIERFDAASYVALLRTMDLHDLGDLAAAAAATAERVARVTGVGCSTDMMVPPAEIRAWVRAYRTAGLSTDYRELSSIHGHDAFVAEPEQVDAALRDRDSPA